MNVRFCCFCGGLECLPYEGRSKEQMPSQKQKKKQKQKSDPTASSSGGSAELLSTTNRIMQSCDQERCLVCFERVKVTHPIWQCGQCFVLLHLSCIQSWITKVRFHACRSMSKE
jgi:hypothetical protein